MPRHRSLRWFLVLVLVIVGATALFVVIGFRNARADPVVRRATIVLPRWPTGARPIAVALVSDIHIGSAAMDARRLDHLAKGITALRPDLILIAGDFIYGHDPDGAARFAPAMVEPLKRLRAPLGVVAVLGNHDHWTGAQAVRDALVDAGITVIENAALRRGPIVLGGIGDRFTGHDHIDRTVQAMRANSGAPVVLTHDADLVGDLPDDIPLLLAGHTHCGQGVIFGRPLGAQPYDPRYRCGLIREGRHVIAITGGLGTSAVPLRIGAPPDLWLLTLSGR